MPLPTKDARDIFERSEEIRKMDMMSEAILKMEHRQNLQD